MVVHVRGKGCQWVGFVTCRVVVLCAFRRSASSTRYIATELCNLTFLVRILVVLCCVRSSHWSGPWTCKKAIELCQLSRLICTFEARWQQRFTRTSPQLHPHPLLHITLDCDLPPDRKGLILSITTISDSLDSNRRILLFQQ